MPPALEARDLVKRYGPTTALDGAHLVIADGEAHALVGRNGAGKSTFVQIVTGLQTPDEGTVSFAGRPAPAVSDRNAWRSSVACVYQHSTIIPSLTVAENVFLNRQRRSNGGLIAWSAVKRESQELLDAWDIPVRAEAMASELSVEQRQMVDIARALSFGARLIILDEPTAQLDARGIERLFSRLRDLQGRGVSVLFISHHLQEIYEICQTVTVFRDARHIVTSPVTALPKSDLIDAMTGEAHIATAADERVSAARPGEPHLLVTGLGRAGEFDDVSLHVQPGEVVGITGSASSGRIELAECIVGLRQQDSGTRTVRGRDVGAGVPAALAAGIGFVPRDRRHEGFVPLLGVGENATMTVPQRFGRFGFIDLRRRDASAHRAIADLSIKATGPEQPVGSLSGGNQQKVVMARALANDPDVLVLMHPTAGVDVRSKQTLMSVVDGVREQGTAVIIVSDELEDLYPCDRVLVMRQGSLVASFDAGWSEHDLVASIEGMEQENV
ncbi:sugar ABC transporter ATP-binding protein [Nocardioides sp. CBS4Y-1]|uniref:Sugar ABC transporter ATP-binding protein n=1 Tax=Nocardioides acrostichi TaxID=2784339 RepID=A0A930V2A2_9ACTN|nr:sugar ABC transporter ATP-binding protein [Nocardioides acrostichi]